MKHHTHIQQNRNRRTLRLESLERRELLSAVPLSASEYAALTAQHITFSAWAADVLMGIAAAGIMGLLRARK